MSSVEIIILSEVCQKEKDKYRITYMWNLKNVTNEPTYKTEIRLTDTEKKRMIAKGEKGGRNKLGVWDRHIHTIICKTNNKDLLYRTGNYTQYLVVSIMEKNL